MLHNLIPNYSFRENVFQYFKNYKGVRNRRSKKCIATKCRPSSVLWFVGLREHINEARWLAERRKMSPVLWNKFILGSGLFSGRKIGTLDCDINYGRSRLKKQLRIWNPDYFSRSFCQAYMVSSRVVCNRSVTVVGDQIYCVGTNVNEIFIFFCNTLWTRNRWRLIWLKFTD